MNNNQDLIKILKDRFEIYQNRHQDLDWNKIQEKLKHSPEKLKSLLQMEQSGGEPDVVGIDKDTGEYLYFDCSLESPAARRSLCYDRQALDGRKENKPKGSVIDSAKAMGIEVLNEQQYHQLQVLGNFDTKSQSWLATPDTIRKLGGAIFGDRRYNHVFIYHNGAESYYAARGFRGCLRL